MDTAPLLVGLAALFVLLTQNAAASPARRTPDQIKTLADKYGLMFGIDPLMIRAIVEIESSRNPLAVRLEPQIMDASIGLMQVLLGTAKWLYSDMGYKALGAPTATNLTDPATGMYFGSAYLDYLSNYKGMGRSVDWVVQSYNAGPGNASPAYLAKFKTARAALGRA